MKAEYISEEMDSSGFVVLADYIPGIIQEIRYHSTYNFIGDRIDGYEEPVALLTKEAARALKSVSNEMMVQGYRLKVYDAYRPARAVKHFVLWGIEDTDIRMKPYFYPDLEKQELFVKGYIAKNSSHSKGSTVDLTLFDMKSGKEVDMGSPFDHFSEVSHPDYKGITDEQYENRMALQKVMIRNGFKPIDCEWWHFTLENEPYPETYFDFPISIKYLK
ncbi:M15 family metallopeptidase [Butyrivibrio fibrisolvens]|uniref:M15 family metallopeptidase n=1 Tax=Butyrivibrio fibrisolvens TaxID=831 RepID=UPI0020BF7D50|nr:M15 family metallopeptidase [Butyrivibrio fibrisolvens]